MSKTVVRSLLLPADPAPPLVLELYVGGASPNSTRAIANLRAICHEHFEDRYSLKIIDVYQHPQIALTAQIYALPMLVRREPLPERRFIGDLSQTQKVIAGLSR